MENKLMLNDSSTKKLISIEKENISIYLCGPTVYNHVHIGNIRPIIIYDVLHRLLTSKGIKVNFVHNITDIDDKIINRAINENVSEKEIANKYKLEYKKILNKLNILPIKMPTVSENMDSIIEYIQKLLDKKNAYFIGENIYFSINNMKEYGSVSNMGINNLEIGSRIKEESKKKSPNDFVIWKKTDVGITWDSPFGNGRPGWHTECSVLINKFIGQQVDIHGGGIDLRFPHHENENIQNIALYNKNLAYIWSHTGHLMVDQKKMSKSLENFVLAKDLLKKYTSNAIRWMFYQTKYEKPLNFFDELLNESQKSINKIEKEINKAYSILLINDSFSINSSISSEAIKLFNNDIDLPNLVTLIYDKLKKTQQNISKNDFVKLNIEFNYIKNIINILGIKFNNIHTEENIELLKSWNNLLKNKEYNKADKIRLQLIKIKLI